MHYIFLNSFVFVFSIKSSVNICICFCYCYKNLLKWVDLIDSFLINIKTFRRARSMKLIPYTLVSKGGIFFFYALPYTHRGTHTSTHTQTHTTSYREACIQTHTHTQRHTPNTHRYTQPFARTIYFL